jgi:hypothetical protein
LFRDHSGYDEENPDGRQIGVVLVGVKSVDAGDEGVPREHLKKKSETLKKIPLMLFKKLNVAWMKAELGMKKISNFPSKVA